MSVSWMFSRAFRLVIYMRKSCAMEVLGFGMGKVSEANDGPGETMVPNHENSC